MTAINVVVFHRWSVSSVLSAVDPLNMKKLRPIKQHPATVAQNAIKIPEGQKLLSAFPTSHMHMNQHGNPGMLMLDYFAINILSAVISKGTWPSTEHINKAYSLASKMVEVRREYVDP